MMSFIFNDNANGGTKIVKFFMMMCAVLIICGCAAKTSYINKDDDKGKAVLSLDYRDFDTAIDEIMTSLLESGILAKEDGGKFVVVTGEILNDTTQRIDTRQLMSSVEEQLLTSGQVDITSAIGSAADDMVDHARELRNSGEFKTETLAPKNAMIAPDLSFSGKIFERVVYYDKKSKQVEYYIQLIATDIKTGLRFWQTQVQILKRGSTKTPLW
jgi:hypothetical protein